jgi:hypothetical protein
MRMELNEVDQHIPRRVTLTRQQNLYGTIKSIR